MPLPTSPYRLVTLGSLHVEGTDWRPAKALALLAYLSVQGPTPRRRLRELFWPEARDSGASLRVLLGHFRRHLPGSVRGEETLETLLGSDAAALLGLGTDAEGVPDARLYTGPFLEGVRLSEISTELGEWVLETRERLAGVARLAAIRAAEVAGSPAEAGQWASRAAALTEAPPLEPGDLERLLRLAAPGSLLEAELRREQAEFGEAAPPLRQPAGQDLLGRERELNLLLLALSDRQNRLVEITGPGGIGKSTLAAVLLREQADLTGVPLLSIPLETAQSASEAAARMVGALRLQVSDRGDGWLALAQGWGERPLLALLDGAEGLPELGRGIETLLLHCPGVRVVVTSRVQRLNGAVHLALDGLGVPAAGETPERVARSAAAQLFVRGARRYLPGFTLDAAHAPLVSAIVRRLDGHPLAMMLSATWMRVYSPAQIHALILQDLTGLRAESGDSERHQLSAVFERSWNLLSPVEAQAICALAVFQTFTPAAALEVTGTTPELLDKLLTHSLLRELSADSQGQRRLEVPPVLAAQATAYLEGAQAILDAHAAYYLNQLTAHPPESDAVNDERANIVAALGHVVSHGGDVSRQIDVLLASYDRRGLLESGSDAFHALRQALPDDDSPTAGSLLVGLAWLASLSSRYREAERICTEVIRSGRFAGSAVRMKLYNTLSSSLRRRGLVEESLPHLERAILEAESRAEPLRVIMYSFNLAERHLDLGQYGACKAINARMVARYQQMFNDELRMSFELQLLSVDFFAQQVAPETLLNSVQRFLVRYASFRHLRPALLAQILEVRVLLRLNRLREAQAALSGLERGLSGAEPLDLQGAYRMLKIELDYAQDRATRARRHVMETVTLFRNTEELDYQPELVLACWQDMADLDPAGARACLTSVASDPRCTHFQRGAASRALESRTWPEMHKELPLTQAAQYLFNLYAAESRAQR
ncbi:ATP-binding protein [Deinococcus altitudinis]|uniref:ATP-binding protein n=1 Tax=Deinococcus altitudinis TaxID=468914 RepID=UPI0038919516